MAVTLAQDCYRQGKFRVRSPDAAVALSKRNRLVNFLFLFPFRSPFRPFFLGTLGERVDVNLNKFTPHHIYRSLHWTLGLYLSMLRPPFSDTHEYVVFAPSWALALNTSWLSYSTRG